MEDTQAVSGGAGQAEAVQGGNQGQAVKVNLDDLPEFRAYKSKTDKAISAYEKNLEESQKKIFELQAKMEELVTDPSARAKMQQERLVAELNMYKEKEAVNKSRAIISEKWGVPAEVLEGAEKPEQMTEKALDYLAQKAKAVERQPEEIERQQRERELENSGANTFTAAPGTPAEQQFNLEIQNKIKELREIARNGKGRAAENARLEILKLTSPSNRPQAPRAKV